MILAHLGALRRSAHALVVRFAFEHLLVYACLIGARMCPCVRRWPADLRFTLSQCVTMTLGVASALEYLHSVNICHGEYHTACHTECCTFCGPWCYVCSRKTLLG